MMSLSIHTVFCLFKDGTLKFSNLNTQEHLWGDSIVLYLKKKLYLFGCTGS